MFVKRYVEVEPICPFMNRPCIQDGWQWDQNIIRPCAFWDDKASMDDVEPCLIMRTVEKVLDIKKNNSDLSSPVEVPWPVAKKRSDSNGK